jgi:uncharacterized protein (DUF2336 family)
VSQPALSRRLIRLEERLATSLFDRPQPENIEAFVSALTEHLAAPPPPTWVAFRYVHRGT